MSMSLSARGARAAPNKNPSPNHQPLPRWLSRSLFVILLSAAVTSLPAIGRYSPLPVTGLLDAWILAFCAYCIVRGRTAAWGAALLVGSYFLLTRVVPAAYLESPVEDFAQAYRWLVYLVAMSLAVGRSWRSLRGLRITTSLLLSLALAKSVLTVAVLGPGSRPGLLLENNFEIALFAGLLALTFNSFGRVRWLAFIAFGLITVLAGSRSGAITFAIFAVWAISQAGIRNLFARYLLVCAIPLVGALPVWVFASRISATAPIDRLNFLTIFWNETQSWTWVNWLFGTWPITPLSPGACNALASYDSLLSSIGDGSCYSVILHAFILRVTYDAGIFGLMLAFGITLYLLKKTDVSFALSACLLLIALANSFSVSGLNSPYVSLPLLLAICLQAPRGGAAERSEMEDPHQLKLIRQPPVTAGR